MQMSLSLTGSPLKPFVSIIIKTRQNDDFTDRWVAERDVTRRDVTSLCDDTFLLQEEGADAVGTSGRAAGGGTPRDCRLFVLVEL